MTLSEIYTKIAQTLHRSDLVAVIPSFVVDALERINRRFGTVITLTDPTPAGTDLLFFYAAMQAAHEYLNNGDNARYYADAWEKEADRQNVLQPGTVTDNYAAEPPFVQGA